MKDKHFVIFAAMVIFLAINTMYNCLEIMLGHK